VAQLHRQALGSLFVASYGSKGYGGILTRLHTGLPSTNFRLVLLIKCTSQKIIPLLIFPIVRTCLFAKPLLSNDCRILAYSAVVA
jgi:hypothetical protein